MVEILKQGQYVPMHVADQVLIIYAATKGHLDEVPVTEIQRLEAQFLAFMKDQKPEIRNTLAEKQELDNNLIEQIEAAIAEFKTQYRSPAEATTPQEATAVV
jgi:F-type H+-transporting ATPase subunit alpha